MTDFEKLIAKLSLQDELYEKFNIALCLDCEKKVKKDMKPYSKADVSRRYKQEIGKLSIANFMSQHAMGKPSKTDPFSISVKKKFNCLLRYCAIVGSHAVAAGKVVFRLKNPQFKKLAIFKTNGIDLDHEIKKQNFIDYLKKNESILKIDSSLLILQIIRPFDFDKIIGRKNPMPAAIELTLSRKMAIILLGTILKNAVFWLWQMLLNPNTVILYRDFAEHPVIDYLNRHNIINKIVITNADYSTQPLPYISLPNRNFTLEMLWYSTNVQRLSFVKYSTKLEHPFYQLLEVDKSWAWNRWHRKWLLENTKSHSSEIHKSQLFYLPLKNSKGIKRAKIVTIFDVTPFDEETLRRLNGGVGSAYYNDQVSKLFWDDIAYLAEKLKNEFQFVYKPKRRYEPGHDKNYIARLKELEEKNLLHRELPDSNLYDLISASKLVITQPFTSPAYIASELGVKSAIFDPSKLIECNCELYAAMHFINSKDDLEKLISQSD